MEAFIHYYINGYNCNKPSGSVWNVVAYTNSYSQQHNFYFMFREKTDSSVEIGKNESIAAQLRPTVAKWYKGTRLISMVGLLTVLLYVGIRVILSSTAADKAKYKKMLMDWLTALCILFILHYIMVFILTISKQITNIFSNLYEGYGTEDVLMNSVRSTAALDTLGDVSKVFGATVCYVALVVLTVIFTFQYLRRVLYMAFLTMIAPLIALTYPIDKIKDGQAQAFSMWIREYIFNSLIQPVHLLIYVMLVESATNLMKTNPIFAIVAISFIVPAEKFIRKMFGFEKASTVGQLGAAAGGAMVMNMINKAKQLGSKGHGGAGSGGSGGSGGSKPIRTASTPATPAPEEGVPSGGGGTSPETHTTYRTPRTSEATRQRREAVVAGAARPQENSRQNPSNDATRENRLQGQEFSEGSQGEQNPRIADYDPFEDPGPFVDEQNSAREGANDNSQNVREALENAAGAQRNQEGNTSPAGEERPNETSGEQGDTFQGPSTPPGMDMQYFAGSESPATATASGPSGNTISQRGDRTFGRRILGAANSVGKRYKLWGEGSLKQWGRRASKIPGIYGGVALGTIGLAAGVATGDLGNAAKYAGAGALAGYTAGGNIANKVTDGVSGVYGAAREGYLGSEEYQNRQFDKKFYQKEYKKLTEKYKGQKIFNGDLKEYTQTLLNNGITDVNFMDKVIGAGYSAEDAVKLSKIEDSKVANKLIEAKYSPEDAVKIAKVGDARLVEKVINSKLPMDDITKLINLGDSKVISRVLDTGLDVNKAQELQDVIKDNGLSSEDFSKFAGLANQENGVEKVKKAIRAGLSASDALKYNNMAKQYHGENTFSAFLDYYKTKILQLQNGEELSDKEEKMLRTMYNNMRIFS